MACNYCFPTRTMSKFRILKERHVQMRKPYQSPGRMKNSPLEIKFLLDILLPRSGIELTARRHEGGSISLPRDFPAYV